MRGYHKSIEVFKRRAGLGYKQTALGYLLNKTVITLRN